jgi:CRISPR type III-B/RAMP module-associated protein Cmr3
MNTILLEPTDVLFFRDGRPMGGSSCGHGAAWPLPNVINHAFHAALHRAELQGVHEHRRGRSGEYSNEESHRDRKFGSLVTAGPFPVCTHGEDHTWFFPRPADADDSGKVILAPYASEHASSLRAPCRHPVVSLNPPSKTGPKSWWSEGLWNQYLGSSQRNDLAKRPFAKADTEFADTESTYGIGISAETGTVEDGKFYSAHYLRLRDGWRLGFFATAPDKGLNGHDLVPKLLDEGGAHIIAGGQQRVCTACFDAKPYEHLPLPLGRSAGFHPHNGKSLVKWVLLSPAVFPVINEHPGGWLPSWIHESTGEVQLLDGPGKNYARRHKLAAGKPIPATLVAAVVPKPIPITGYALPHEAADRADGGAKPTHLAVPAGAVYYFETTEPAKLAAALNWHGTEAKPTAIRNRRSTLFGEKGFGLGVCGTWQFHSSGGR